MAASKSSATLQASASNAAGATTTSTALNLTAAYGGIIVATVTNGSTAPTGPCSATVNISPDGTTWSQFAQQTAGMVASSVYPMAFELPMSVMYAQVVFSGNTGSAVTVAASAEYVTGI